MTYLIGESSEIVPWTVLSGSVASIDFTSIPASYNNLLIRCMLRSDAVATADGFYLRFNDDATIANYSSYTIRHSGTTGAVTATERRGATATGIEHTLCAAAASSPTNYRSIFNIQIFDYASTSRIRMTLAQGAVYRGTATNDLINAQVSGLWTNIVDAISKVAIIPLTGPNFVAGSAYSLHGF